MAGYCIVDNLLIGNIPTSNGLLDPQKFIDDAKDEIDSQIGARYILPIDLFSAPTSALILLKRINSHLASGRLIMAASAAGSQDSTHAYGRYLVREAQNSLRDIVDGKIDLDIPTIVVTPEHAAGPLIYNVDSRSQVEAFYETLANPLAPEFGSPYRSAGG